MALLEFKYYGAASVLDAVTFSVGKLIPSVPFSSLTNPRVSSWRAQASTAEAIAGISLVADSRAEQFVTTFVFGLYILIDKFGCAAHPKIKAAPNMAILTNEAGLKHMGVWQTGSNELPRGKLGN